MEVLAFPSPINGVSFKPEDIQDNFDLGVKYGFPSPINGVSFKL